MIKAYICHPYANDPKGNIEKVTEIVKEFAALSIDQLKNGTITSAETHLNREFVVVPIVPLFAFPPFMSEDGDVDREIALAFCLALLEGCDEIWVCSKDITSGMQLEISKAAEWGIKIVWKS